MPTRIETTLPFAAYRDDPGVNASLLKLALTSPFAAKWDRDHPGDDDDGDRPLFRAVHTMLLEGEAALVSQFNECPVARNPKQAPFQAWLAANPGKTALTTRQAAKLVAIREAAADQGIAAQLGTGAGEVSVFWHDADHGIDCKARLDWTNADRIVDVKHVGALDLHAIESQAYSLAWDLQLAHYCRAAAAAGLSVERVALLLISTDAPHDMALLPVSETLLLHGEQRRTDAMAAWAKAVQANRYPRASEALAGVSLGLPGWVARRQDVSEIDAELARMGM